MRRDWERSIYERCDREDRAAMNIDPHPSGVTIRAFTAAEITALDAPFKVDRACGACGLITEDDLFHDCDLAPAGMATIKARLELVPYVVVDALGFYYSSTSSRAIAISDAVKVRGRVVTTVYGEIQEVKP